MSTNTPYLSEAAPVELAAWLRSAAEPLIDAVRSRAMVQGLIAIVFIVGLGTTGYVLVDNTAGAARSAPLPVGQRLATISAKLGGVQLDPSAAGASVSRGLRLVSGADPIGSASMVLGEGLPLDEADNMRWSLIRRTPAAASVYNASTGVDWGALRGIEASGDILVPSGFVWSFNETFQSGPGYKEASGILAGGHCALATVFNAAVKSAGLPTDYRPHRTPYPGYTVDQCVNIYWGRDDLRTRNTTGNDIQLRWVIDGQRVSVQVVPVPEAGTTLPALDDATIAMTYGRPKGGGWGTLGQTQIVDQAVHAALRFGARVDEWNGQAPVVVAINPNVVMAGTSEVDEAHIFHLSAEAERRQAFVMLDVQTGSQDPAALFGRLMDKYLRENVWFDWDLEHAEGGKVHAAQINSLASEYFRRRAERGYQRPGVFAFYIFQLDAVQGVGELQTTFSNGTVLPIFDGYGSRDLKISQTNRFRNLFSGGPYGIMEFETRWGSKYDQIGAQEYLGAFPDAKIFASQ